VDDVDRRILLALRADGRASLADLAREVEVPASTVYRRLSALLAERRAHVAVLPLADQESLRLYEVRVRCQPGRQRDVAQKLTQRHDTRWVAIVTGDYGVAAELAVPAGTEVASVLFEDIEQSDEHILGTQSSLVLHTFKGAPSGRGFPCDAEICTQPVDPSTSFDAVDRDLLRLLRDDGRRSYASLAAELGASESTVRRRVNGLLEGGNAETVTIVQPASLGYDHEAILRLDVLPQHLESIAHELAAHAGVHYVAATFGETALVCELQMRSPRELYDFLVGTVGRAGGITRTSVEIELIVTKRAFVPTPWSEPAPLAPLDGSSVISAT
jgi:DNA-binding Lrp family transcriptional regulator